MVQIIHINSDYMQSAMTAICKQIQRVKLKVQKYNLPSNWTWQKKKKKLMTSHNLYKTKYLKFDEFEKETFKYQISK